MFVIKHYWIDPEVHGHCEIITVGHGFKDRPTAEHEVDRLQRARHDETDCYWVEEES